MNINLFTKNELNFNSTIPSLVNNSTGRVSIFNNYALMSTGNIVEGCTATNPPIKQKLPGWFPQKFFHYIPPVVGNSKQSEKSYDCWLLSAINALNSSQAGRKILKEAIVRNSDGSYTITLKGANNRKIEVSTQELAEAKESDLYVKSNEKMLAFEIAFDKYRAEVTHQTPNERKANGLAVNWGYPSEAFYLLTGKKPNCHNNTNTWNIGNNYYKYGNDQDIDVSKTIDKMLSSNTIAMTCTFNTDGETEIEGNKLAPGHAYAVHHVAKMNGKTYVFIINPSDSSKMIKISKEAFIEHLSSIYVLPLDNN